ncbi:MAG TPA: VIT1/CCC1 transporter family protein [Candidatus Saccharimonadia bacterium]|nr:VIT1/CCC1 transporter family protein [Candidatus Saccharimonadia bacterium]
METRTNAKNLKRIEQAQSGAARAALLGISDGLVTNVSLILGVAGAGASAGVVRLAGVASLIAGACSMAVGEYISMRGQVELLSSVLEVEREQLERDPKTAHEVMESIFVADGVSKETAHNATIEISKDPAKAMAMYARGKLGVNPNELGSAKASAASSFVMFSLGALVPLVPWFFPRLPQAVALSIFLSVLAALGVGSYLGYVTNGKPLRAALRQLIVLIAAASATYIIGRLLHTSLT